MPHYMVKLVPRPVPHPTWAKHFPAHLLPRTPPLDYWYTNITFPFSFHSSTKYTIPTHNAPPSFVLLHSTCPYAPPPLPHPTLPHPIPHPMGWIPPVLPPPRLLPELWLKRDWGSTSSEICCSARRLAGCGPLCKNKIENKMRMDDYIFFHHVQQITFILEITYKVQISVNVDNQNHRWIHVKKSEVTLT